MNLQEYYLNLPRNHECVKLPGKNAKYLLKDNFLNEFFSEDDKAEARSNLGITPLLEELKGLITAKLFDETGNVTFDLEPHEDAYDKVLSSAALYRLFLNYYTKQELDSWKEDLREDFNTFKEEAKIIVDKELDETSINPVENKAIALKLREILTAYTTLFNTKADKDDFLNYYTIDEVESKILEKLDDIESLVNRLDELEETLSAALETINRYIKPNAVIKIISLRFDGEKTYLKATINSEMAVLNNAKIYVNGELVEEKDELSYSWEIPFEITEDSDIRVEVQNIFGGVNTAEKHIINGYFLPSNMLYIGGGLTYQDVFASTQPQEINDRSYNFTMEDDLKIILLLPLNFVFIRGDMNGVEIPFEEPFVVNNFKCLISKNSYFGGEYNIDINS